VSKRDRSNRALLIEIKRIHEDSRGTYGEPRIRAQLRADGIRCSKKRIARLMKQAGITGIATKRFRVTYRR